MLRFQLISITNLFPIIGSIFIMLMNKKLKNNIKIVALWITLFTGLFYFVSLYIHLQQRIFGQKEFVMLRTHSIEFNVFVDSVSLVFVPLIILICFLVVLWLQKKDTPQNDKKFFVSLLAFESLAISAFMTSDIFLLFIFIESSLIPLYIMLNSSNAGRNFEAILNFIIYSAVSAMLILVAIIMIYIETGISSLTEIYQLGFSDKLAFLLLFLGIGMKIPVWPFYHWLPIVHVKSSTCCSIVLAAIVLKYSALLINRLIMPIFDNLLITHFNILFFVFSFSMLCAFCQSIFQDDLKKFFAYFSIIHMNMACIIPLTNQSTQFIYSILSHSLVVSLLFFSVALYKTRSISDLRKLGINSKELRYIFLAGMLALIGAPFCSSFISEIICVMSAAKLSISFALIIAGIILASSAYVFYLCFSIPSNKNLQHIIDPYNKLAIYTLIFFTLLLGTLPKIAL